MLDRPIFDDDAPSKRAWPPKHGDKTARDALEAADQAHEEEEEAAAAKAAAAAGSTKRTNKHGTPPKSGTTAWVSANQEAKSEPLSTSGGSAGDIGVLSVHDDSSSSSGGGHVRSSVGAFMPPSVAIDPSRTASSYPSELVEPSSPVRRLKHEGLRVLLCGWRRDVKDMLLLMEQVLPSGSTVRILSERPPEFVDEYLADHCSSFTRITVRCNLGCVLPFRRGVVCALPISLFFASAMRSPNRSSFPQPPRLTCRQVLHAYGRADVRRRLVESNALGFDTADEVDVCVVVADEEKEKDLLLSDSQTIATCLLVRDVQADHRENRDVSLADLSVLSLESLQIACPMTAEILDVATRATIEENPAIKAIADFIVVNDLAARLIAAVADRREVASVLGQLLGPDPKSQVKRIKMLVYFEREEVDRSVPTTCCLKGRPSCMRHFTR